MSNSASASGGKEPDLLVKNVDLVNVFDEEIKRRDISIVGKKIVGIEESEAGDDTRVIDGEGKVAVPGLIDAHAHIAEFQNAGDTYRYMLKGGNTSLVTEIIKPSQSFSVDGLSEFLRAVSDLPIKVFPLLPPYAFFDPVAGKARNLDKAPRWLEDDRIVGFGEFPWIHVLGNQKILDLYRKASEEGKRVEIHGAGGSERVLTELANHHVSSDHESISSEDVMKRLDRGLHAFVRAGSIREDISILDNLSEGAIDSGEVSLVSDEFWPPDLLEGSMDLVVKKALNYVDPITAVKMTTINPARYFRIDHLVGSIAPGRRADIVLLDSLEEFEISDVIAEGELVVKDGHALVDSKFYDYPAEFRNPVEVKAKPEDLKVLPTDSDRVRTIKMRGEMVSKEVESSPIRSSEDLKPDPEKDLLKLACISWDGRKKFVGFLKGFGLNEGALGTGGAWERPAVIVVGSNNECMAKAVNKISENSGVYLVSEDGETVEEMPLEVFSSVPTYPMEEVADRLERINETVKDLGSTLRNPVLTLSTITFTGVPELRIRPEGYYNVMRQEVQGLE